MMPMPAHLFHLAKKTPAGGSGAIQIHRKTN
jgi:hypothetical protein